MAKVSAPKIAPCLRFDDSAQEAVRFYTSVFTNSKIIVEALKMAAEE